MVVEVTEDRLDATEEVDLCVAELLLEVAVVTEVMLPFEASLGRVMTFLRYLSSCNYLRTLPKTGDKPGRDKTVTYPFRGGSRSGANVSSEVRGASIM